MPNSIVAIFAHPDDEILACGASLAKHVSTGAVVRILLLASGLTARGPVATSAMDELRDHARRAADVIGAESVVFGEFPDNRMDTVPLLDVVQVIEEFLGDMTPEILYTHNDTDLNIDHQVVQRAVITACRPTPGRVAHEIRSGEVNSSTEWNAGFGKAQWTEMDTGGIYVMPVGIYLPVSAWKQGGMQAGWYLRLSMLNPSIETKGYCEN